MSYEVKGKITAIQPIEEFDSGAKKVTFQLDTGEQYNNLFAFELFKTGEHVKFVDNFPTYNKVGDTVTVEFNVNTREYNGKYYTNLTAWKVTGEGKTTTADKAETFVADDSSDLPF